jgi:invasion protein IalB
VRWRRQRDRPRAAASSSSRPAPPKPERTEILHFDNWNVTCHEFAQGPKKRVCSAELQVRHANNNVVFAWTVGLDEQNRPVNVLQTPTGVLIGRGVELRLDKLTPRTVPFTTCDTGRCTAVLSLDEEMVRGLSTSDRAEATIYALNGNGVRFGFQLKGFDKAYAALRR